MSNQYIFTDGDDQQILLQDGSIIWNDQLNEEASLHYFDANDTVVSSNESYSTAIDANETQYLSVLENSDNPEVTLDDLQNITINNEEEEGVLPADDPPQVANSASEETNEENQVIVFTIDGGDDLYGIQMIRDDAGNVQKYQFKFRTTADGQLELMPETVTLLEEQVDSEEVDVDIEEEVDTEQENVLVKNENSKQDEINIEHVFIKGERESPEPEDIETIPESATLQKNSVKQELLLSSQDSEDQDEIFEENILEETIQNEEQYEIESKIAIYDKEEQLEDINEDSIEDQEQLVETFFDDNNHVEKQLEQGNRVEETQMITEYLEEDFVDNSKAEQFSLKGQEIITPEVPLNAEERVNILRHTQDKPEDKMKKSMAGIRYYVMYPEKENVNSLAGNNNLVQTPLAQLSLPKSTNPRSVLKMAFDKEKDKAKKCMKTQDPMTQCEFYDKRFAKNKEAMHVKNFHSFLNRTTIPHAPVRQKRQPRKQEIKARERGNEEIIVQEVIISSNGYIENANKRRRIRKQKVTAVVEVSDSEEDTNPTDSRQSARNSPDITIIEINSDTEDPVSKTDTVESQASDTPNSLKRRRGRPPKLNKGNFVAKRNKADPDTSDKLPFKKKEIVCPRCPKTFASQNSLNTHLIHHNLENNLKSKARMSTKTMPRQSLLPKYEYNHKCETCLETFKNTILLKNHKCAKKQNDSSHNCSVCLKKFRDITLLNIHKKTHAKANLVKNTSIIKVSPRKMGLKPTTLKAKSPKKPFKCTECPKICDTNETLANHTKAHKKLVCSSCLATFSSKFLLETHIRTNCIKLKSSASANNRRLSFTIKKSFINTPPRRMTLAKPADKTLNDVLGVKLDCDQCDLKFSTFRTLYTHKVQTHGLNTPDKSLMTKPKTKRGDYKPKPAHGGVPMNPKLQKAYATLRKKLAETTDLVIQ